MDAPEIIRIIMFIGLLLRVKHSFINISGVDNGLQSSPSRFAV